MNELKEIEALLPPSFYGDRDLKFRIKMLVDSWERAIESNIRLEAELSK
jgi:hypothetical protein